MKFIYVFTDQDRDELLSRGYILLKEDKSNQIYIFSYDGKEENFDSLNLYCFSNVLTF